MKKAFLLAVTVFVTGILGACNVSIEDKDDLVLMKTNNLSPAFTDRKENQNAISSIKKDVEKFSEIYDVIIIKGKEDILITYRVKQMQRFRMKKIEQRIKEELKKNYPKERFTVSSDYKIFLEAARLQKKVKDDPQYTKERAEKRFQEILKLQKELT